MKSVCTVSVRVVRRFAGAGAFVIAAACGGAQAVREFFQRRFQFSEQEIFSFTRESPNTIR